MEAVSEAVRAGDWVQLARACRVDASATPAEAAVLAHVGALARFNVAAQRAAGAWRRSPQPAPPVRGKEARLAWLAVERLRAAIEGRAVDARQILAQELDTQPSERDPADVAPCDVIDLVAHRVRPAPRLRVRGVGRPLPDHSPGLADPGSIFTLRLLGCVKSWFERGRPLDLVGAWDATSATFAVQHAVVLGLWPGRRVLRHALGRSDESEEAALASSVTATAGPLPFPPRDYVAESLMLHEAVATLERSAAASGVSFGTLGAVHRLLAPTAARAGHMRSTPVTVRLGSAPFYQPPTPPVARSQVRSLLRWLRRSDVTSHPLARAAEAWARLTTAHPFHDGNGRVARALAAWILMAAGYRQHGAEDLGDYAHQYVVEYYHRLNRWETERLLWYQFCADAVLGTFDLPSTQ